MTSRFFQVVQKPLHDLGHNEREVLLTFGRGSLYKEIAESRGKDYSTIKNQLESARKKLGCRRTFEAYLKLVAIEDKARSTHA